jgi:hypothetical protein
MSELVEQKEAKAKGWSWTVRLLVAVAGGGLIFYGMRRKTTRFGRISTQLGIGLVTRGLAGTQFGGLAGFLASTLIKPENFLTPYKPA